MVREYNFLRWNSRIVTRRLFRKMHGCIKMTVFSCEHSFKKKAPLLSISYLSKKTKRISLSLRNDQSQATLYPLLVSMTDQRLRKCRVESIGCRWQRGERMRCFCATDIRLHGGLFPFMRVLPKGRKFHPVIGIDFRAMAANQLPYVGSSTPPPPPKIIKEDSTEHSMAHLFRIIWYMQKALDKNAACFFTASSSYPLKPEKYFVLTGKWIHRWTPHSSIVVPPLVQVNKTTHTMRCREFYLQFFWSFNATSTFAKAWIWIRCLASFRHAKSAKLIPSDRFYSYATW